VSERPDRVRFIGFFALETASDEAPAPTAPKASSVISELDELSWRTPGTNMATSRPGAVYYAWIISASVVAYPYLSA